jgi:phosphopantetheinyl transferase
MRAVYLLDFGLYSEKTEKITESLPSYLSKKILNPSNEKRRKERAFSYFLAYNLIKKSHPCDENATLCFSESGKPYVEKGVFSISLAHSGTLAAIFISDENEEVGIDIELITEKSEKTAEAFLKNREISFSTSDNINIEIFIANILDDIKTDLLNERYIALKEDLSSTDKWTYCEAVLKCDGAGIGGIKNIEKIITGASVKVYNVDVNETKYSLSVSVKNKIKQ